jgi:hypothetical protein
MVQLQTRLERNIYLDLNHYHRSKAKVLILFPLFTGKTTRVIQMISKFYLLRKNKKSLYSSYIWMCINLSITTLPLNELDFHNTHYWSTLICLLQTSALSIHLQHMMLSKLVTLGTTVHNYNRQQLWLKKLWLWSVYNWGDVVPHRNQNTSFKLEYWAIQLIVMWKDKFFCVVTSCSVVVGYQCLRGPCCLQHPEDGGSMDLQNTGVPSQHYMASQTIRPQLETSPLWKPQNSYSYVSFMYRIYCSCGNITLTFLWDVAVVCIPTNCD